MRGLRSTLVLLVVLLCAGGYAYYISKKPAEDSSSKQEKVFGTIQADKIEQIRKMDDPSNLSDLAELGRLAAAVIVMRLVDLFWLIAPGFRPESIGVHWMDLAAPVGLGGIWLATLTTLPSILARAAAIRPGRIRSPPQSSSRNRCLLMERIQPTF